MKFIIKKYGQQITEKILVEGQEYFIGRDSDCDIVLDAEPGISRQHFKVYSSQPGCWTIECVSTHGDGLYIEGEQVQGAEIENSTSLSFKNYVFQFILEEEEPTVVSDEEITEVIETEEDISPTSSDKAPIDDNTRILPPSHLSYFLAISIDGSNPEYISLNQGDSWILGRKEKCDICINHPSLSGEHLKIERSGNQFYIKDLKSSNGTFLNDTQLEPGQSQPLKSEDKIEALDFVMTFEAQNRKFAEIIKNLPVKAEQTTIMENPLVPSEVMLPKVVLEEFSEDNEEDGKERFFNRKRIILLSILGLILGGAVWLQMIPEEKEEIISAEQAALDAKAKAIQDFYQMATTLYQQKKYQFCIENLNKLHEMISYYKDSKELLTQCQNALSARKRLEEQELLKKQAEETERKIKEIVASCHPRLDIFESVEELNVCLAEAIQLNPEHLEINALQRIIQERESLKLLKKQEQEELKKRILKTRAYYRSLYKKAKKAHEQAENARDQERLLKAADAYDQFVHVSRHESSMAEIRKLATQTAQTIRDTYRTTLDELYSNCEGLIEQKQMKQAYPVCKKILEFKDDDEKAVHWMEEAKTYLRVKLKSIYEKSAQKESLSNIRAARPLWQQIVKEDIEGGYYYEKAIAKLKKYE
ncbi:MAG: FHA domain-containing protein [Bdellovibrionales bacterium]|nr:FHA domain-containing protein [Bdellovibrionales bacterium]